MRILIVDPGSEPYPAEIGDSLEAMQSVVGGLIDAVYPFEERIALICNDEGCLLNLPTNRPLVNPETGEIYDVVQGTFFLCGAPESSEHFTSLTEEELAKFSKEFSLSKLLHLLSFT